jgi:hypothetical protein
MIVEFRWARFCLCRERCRSFPVVGAFTRPEPDRHAQALEAGDGGRDIPGDASEHCWGEQELCWACLARGFIAMETVLQAIALLRKGPDDEQRWRSDELVP